MSLTQLQLASHLNLNAVDFKMLESGICNLCVSGFDQVLLKVGKGKLATEELIWHFYQSSQTFIRDGWVGGILNC